MIDIFYHRYILFTGNIQPKPGEMVISLMTKWMKDWLNA